jgi:hypothetical protein
MITLEEINKFLIYETPETGQEWLDNNYPGLKIIIDDNSNVTTIVQPDGNIVVTLTVEGVEFNELQ